MLAILAAVVLLFPRSGAAAGDRPIRILAFGDSLTAGFGLPHADGFVARLQGALDERHAGVTLLDGGVSGDTTTGARARLDWALADKPDAAIVELGGNDALRGTDPGVTEANLSAIIDRFERDRIPVLLSGMIAPPNMGQSYGDSFKAVFSHIARAHANDPLLIYDPFFLEGLVGRPELAQNDHIHPNAAGVRAVVARITPLVLRLAALARRLPEGTGGTPAGGATTAPATAGGSRSR
ncbi:arylesterase [Rhizosaccharibacter radicis]|uniref:Arylesterase n=1 Tax=Rhizosaccharibacter radicis TaxID=2782605 RepID=A0ABT1VX06_9PROT|nr:arylesterase [Acetobacteraceae bacterium KSS12]